MLSVDVREGCDKWRVIKFADLKQTLQAKCNEVANLQEESEASRKKLIEMSREFKRTTDESVRNQVAPLMKYFQKEIDSLLHRSKTGESCLLELLQKFVPLPAPDKLFSVLFNTMDTLRDDMKNRDRTITHLKEQVEELDNLNSKVFTQRWEERENNLRLELAENENLVKNEILTLKNDISNLKNTIQRNKDSHRESEQEIIDLRNKHELELTAKSQEVELLLADQERLQLQLGNALAKNDTEFEQIIFQPQNKFVVELEQELLGKENEIDILNQKLIEIGLSMSEMNEIHSNEKHELNSKLSGVKNRVLELENILQQQSNYHEIKKELSTLKMIEFGSSKETEVSDSAETLLVTKNKQLQTQCTNLRTENDRLNADSRNFQGQLQNAHAKIDKYEKQIEQLEHDIVRLQQLLPPRPEAEGVSSPNNDTALSSNDFLTELVQNQQTQQGNYTSNTEKDHGLITILLSQRERMKEKHLALQHDFDTVKHKSNELQVRISTLEHDNMRLYEKIRFLQSYPQSTTARIQDKSFQRYSHDYESKLDPFTVFNRNEIFSRYSRMPGTDRAVFNIGKVILSNRISRRLALFYLLLVHILLFCGMYFYTYYETCKIDAYTDCLRSFEEHIQVHHA